MPRGSCRRRCGCLLAESVELVRAHPSLEEAPGVHTGGGMALIEDVVTTAGMVLAAEEVVEPDFVERRGRRVGRDVAADLDAGPLRAVHQHGGVPAVPAAEGALDLFVAGEPWLFLGADRVDVIRGREAGDARIALACTVEQAEHDVPGADRARLSDETVQRIEPFPGLLRIDIRDLTGETVEDRSSRISRHDIPPH